MTSGSSDTGPLALFNQLMLEGRAPDPNDFCAEYSDCPDLRQRIAALVGLRADLGTVRYERPTDSWAPPAEIGGFRVLRPLGSGGMGHVYLAEQIRPTWLFALKFMRPHRSRVERFQREAKLARQLDHPGIAALHTSGIEQGVAYIASELVHGFSLRDLLKAAEVKAGDSDPSWITDALGRVATGTHTHRLARSRGGIGALTLLAQQVAAALGHAHQHGVVHRDVKPSNIMVTFDGSTKLIDFGMALPTTGGEPRLTTPGVFVGSLDYAAPEQLSADRGEIGPWTDTYALGVTLFELLTRHRLSPQERRDPPALRALNPALSTELESVVQRALAPEPSDRFQDGRELAAALAAIGAGEMTTGGQVELADEPTAPATTAWSFGPPPAARDVFRRNFARLSELVSAARETAVVIAAFHRDEKLEAHAVVDPCGTLAERAIVMGRLPSVGLPLQRDASISLRHAVIVAQETAGVPRLRLSDLNTRHGFTLDGVGRCDTLELEGVLALQLGGYWLFFLPAASRPWSGRSEEVWERFAPRSLIDDRPREARDVAGATEITAVTEIAAAETTDTAITLPPAGKIASHVRLLRGVADVTAGEEKLPAAADTVGTLIVDRPSGTTSVTVTRQQLERGLLLGRNNRLDVGSGDLWETDSVSRAHLLLLGEGDRILLVDTASTNGTILNGEKLGVGVMSGRANLRLGSVNVRWQPVR